MVIFSASLLYFFMIPPLNNLKVALITTSDFLSPSEKVWKASTNLAKGYLDLLILNVIPYDIIWIDKKETYSKLTLNHRTTSHSLIILALDGRKLPEKIINSIKKANDNGINVISDISSLDDALLSYLKIKRYSESFPADKLEIIENHKVIPFHPRYVREIRSENGELYAKFNDKPVVIEIPKGNGKNYILGFTGRELFKQYDFFHKFLRDLIISASSKGLVYYSFDNKAILRMDDPGSSHRVWLNSPKYDSIDFDISFSQWMDIIKTLKNQYAKMSIMYTPIFVDDGDKNLGKVFYKGKEILERKCGNQFLSKEIMYIKRNPSFIFDFKKSFEAIKYGLRQKVFEIQLHGYSHLTVNVNKWCNSLDKKTNVLWLSEYYDAIDNKEVDFIEQKKRIEDSYEIIKKLFGEYPDIFSPPAHLYSGKTLEAVQLIGIPFMHSLVFYKITPEKIIEMDEVKSAWAHTSIGARANLTKVGYPVVLGFHDWDFKKHSTNWFNDYLNDWKRKGIKNFISFGEFTGYLRLSINSFQRREYIEGTLTINENQKRISENNYFKDNPFGLMVKIPDKKEVKRVQCGGEVKFLECQSKNICRMECPPFYSKEQLKFKIEFR